MLLSRTFGASTRRSAALRQHMFPSSVLIQLGNPPLLHSRQLLPSPLSMSTTATLDRNADGDEYRHTHTLRLPDLKIATTRMARLEARLQTEGAESGLEYLSEMMREQPINSKHVYKVADAFAAEKKFEYAERVLRHAVRERIHGMAKRKALKTLMLYYSFDGYVDICKSLLKEIEVLQQGHAGPKEYHLLIQSMRFNEDSTAGEMEELLSSLPAKGIAPPRRSVASVLTKIKEKKEFEPLSGIVRIMNRHRLTDDEKLVEQLEKVQQLKEFAETGKAITPVYDSDAEQYRSEMRKTGGQKARVLLNEMRNKGLSTSADYLIVSHKLKWTDPQASEAVLREALSDDKLSPIDRSRMRLALVRLFESRGDVARCREELREYEKIEKKSDVADAVENDKSGCQTKQRNWKASMLASVIRAGKKAQLSHDIFNQVLQEVNFPANADVEMKPVGWQRLVLMADELSRQPLPEQETGGLGPCGQVLEAMTVRDYFPSGVVGEVLRLGMKREKEMGLRG